LSQIDFHTLKIALHALTPTKQQRVHLRQQISTALVPQLALGLDLGAE